MCPTVAESPSAGTAERAWRPIVPGPTSLPDDHGRDPEPHAAFEADRADPGAIGGSDPGGDDPSAGVGSYQKTDGATTRRRRYG